MSIKLQNKLGGILPSGITSAIDGLGSSIKTELKTATKTEIVADGKNTIVSYKPAVGNAIYFHVKNENLEDFNTAIVSDNVPDGSLTIRFFDVQESKSFSIPEHIKEGQKDQYIKEQFNFD